MTAKDFDKYGPSDAHTPLMRQWLSFKREIGEERLLFFRVGDFYELFWEDAEAASTLLDLQTAKRGESGGIPVIMAGVPWHALDVHLSKIIRMGRKAAVVDQVGDPALSKGPVERVLSRMVSPGTLLDDALLDEKSDAPLMACSNAGGRVGIFWLSLASGHGRHFECDVAALKDEIARIAPAEILVPESFFIDDETDSKFTRLNAWRFDSERGGNYIREHFGCSDISSFGFSEKTNLSLAAFCALYAHSRQSLGGRRPLLSAISPEIFSDILQIDAATRRALEIIETQRGEREPTLLSLMDLAASHMGSRRIRLWLSCPSADINLIRQRHEAVSELRQEAAKISRDFLISAKRFCDIERVSSRISVLSARPRDFSSLRSALEKLPSLVLPFSLAQSSLLRDLASRCSVPENCIKLLRDVVADEPPNFAKDGGVVRRGYSAELDQLRALSDNVDTLLEELQEREREATGIPNLRIEFNRARGFQIEVSKSHVNKVPDRYRRNQTLKNAERYTTDELDALAGKALGAQEASARLEKQIFETFQNDISQYGAELSSIADAFASLDALSAFALLSEDRKYVAPSISDEPTLHLSSVRHPVAEISLGDAFVPNDATLSVNRRAVVVTGPNMGGKSTYMRSCALSVVMSQAGCHVPAAFAELSVFDRLCARVGASDDIARGQSTFMVEMVETASILRLASPRTLVIVDEIGRGTSTYDGMSIAWACLRHLHDVNKSLTLFSTHYFEITDMASVLDGCANVHMTATPSDDGVVFLHKLEPGPAAKSHGIDVAKIAGIPALALLWANEAHALVSERGAFESVEHPNIAASDLDVSKGKVLLDFLKNVNPDEMSPREAMETLYRIRSML